LLYSDGTKVQAAGAAVATSLALGGATIGTNALAVTGSSLFPGSTSISSTGLVGIGMTPSNILDITQNQNGASAVSILNSNTGAASQSYHIATNGTSSVALQMFGTGYTTSGVSRQSGAILQCTGAGGLTLNTAAAQPIYFGINSAEVARFDTSGNLLVGTTTAYGAVSSLTAGSGSAGYFRATNASYTGINILSMTTAAASAGCYYFAGQSSAGAINNILIYGNGNVYNTNNSYGAISDIKLKQDIVLAGSQWNDIKAIGNIVSKYRFKNTPDGPLQIGVIAQDLQKISPGLIISSKDFTMADGEQKFSGEETLSVNYSVLYMKAVKALGEALERIETLEARLTALETK